jgi:hypothetical protein
VLALIVAAPGALAARRRWRIHPEAGERSPRLVR